MKNYTSSKAIALLGLIATAAVASANIPPINVSAGAVGGVTGSLGGSFGASGVTSAAGSTVGGGFNGAMATIDANPSAGFQAGPVPGHRIAAFESIGMRQARLAADAEATRFAETATSTETSVSTLPNEHAASAMLTTGFSADTIRAASVEERAQLAKDIDTRIDTSAQAMKSLKAEAKSLNGEAKAEFKAASKDVAAREKELRASMKAASKASAETWTERRAEVAANYEAYAQSVARAESTVMAAQPEVGATQATSANTTTAATKASAATSFAHQKN